MNEQILTKVKRLMALSDNNANVNEAANAFRAAQKILSEHRLSVADVDLISDDGDEEKVKSADEGLYVGKRAINWKGSLATGIAQCNGCDAYWSHTWDSKLGDCKALKVVGRESDIEIVRWLYSSVVSQIEAFCKLEMTFNKGGGKTFANSFKHGASNSVVSRLEEAKQEVETKYNGTQALVLVKNKDEVVAQHMASLGLRKIAVKNRNNRSAYDAGAEAGKRINISRGGLNSGTKKLN